MGLIKQTRKKLAEWVSPKEVNTEQQLGNYFEMFSGYSPVYTSHSGGLYERELTRACVHSFATHVSKLEFSVQGYKGELLKPLLKVKPNELQTVSQFLYQLATIYMVENNALIVPTFQQNRVTGWMVTSASGAELLEHRGELFLRYQLLDGTWAAAEYSRCGIMNQMQFKNQIFGEGNSPLHDTIELMQAQSDGIKDGIRSGAAVRFLAQLNLPAKSEHVEKERARFVKNNLSAGNGGVVMFDQAYTSVQQINSQPFIVDDKQTALIKTNVFNYFGTNEKILQSSFTSPEWNAYYEGRIEPFAIQLSQVMTAMNFTRKEQAHGNEIYMTTDRMRYLTAAEKLDTVTQLFDRGFITHNMGLKIFDMPTIGEEGDQRYIRLEYANKNDIEPDGTVVTTTLNPLDDESEDEPNENDK